MEYSQMYRSILGHMREQVYVRDLEMNLIYMNPAAEELTGWPFKDAEGKKCHDVFGDENRTCKEVCPVEKAITKKLHILHHEGRLRTRSGEDKDMRVSISPLYEAGALIGAVIVMDDITKLKEISRTNEKTLIALEKERNKSRLCLDLAEAMFVSLDVDGNVEMVNKRGCEILAWEEHEIIGVNWFDHFIRPEKAEEMKEVFDQLISGNPGPVECYENPVLSKDGVERSIAWRNAPIRDVNGRITGVLSSGVDVTEPGRAETARRIERDKLKSLAARDIWDKKTLRAEVIRAGRLASLGELAAGTAHEINNPVNGIIGYAELLKDACDEKGEDDDIPVRIIEEGERVAAIVRNLLSFAGKQSADLAPVHPREILSDALALVEKQIQRDGITLTADIPPGLPPATARTHEIQLVFLNLISNARYALGRKFPSRHEDKTLEIKGETVKIHGRGHVRITFRDAGPGIPEKILDRIITPFFSTKPPGRGAGLGLSISRDIIEAHGGKLRFESMEGEYTKVVVDLPAEESPRKEGPV